jgi:hypothetical protein
LIVGRDLNLMTTERKRDFEARTGGLGTRRGGGARNSSEYISKTPPPIVSPHSNNGKVSPHVNKRKSVASYIGGAHVERGMFHRLVIRSDLA